MGIFFSRGGESLWSKAVGDCAHAMGFGGCLSAMVTCVLSVLCIKVDEVLLSNSAAFWIG